MHTRKQEKGEFCKEKMILCGKCGRKDLGVLCTLALPCRSFVPWIECVLLGTRPRRAMLLVLFCLLQSCVTVYREHNEVCEMSVFQQPSSCHGNHEASFGHNDMFDWSI